MEALAPGPTDKPMPSVRRWGPDGACDFRRAEGGRHHSRKPPRAWGLLGGAAPRAQLPQEALGLPGLGLPGLQLPPGTRCVGSTPLLADLGAMAFMDALGWTGRNVAPGPAPTPQRPHPVRAGLQQSPRLWL